MPAARLHIDTDVSRDNATSKKPSIHEKTSTPAALSPNPMGTTRLRSGSTASTSSSLSVDSPGPSSSAASTSSLQLPEPGSSSSRQGGSGYPMPSPVSPSQDETVRVAPEFVLALHDFAPQQQNATCLSFRAGQVIRVLNRDASGWWDGEINDQRGWFPSNYVSADEGVISLTEEELPRTSLSQRQGPGHAHTMSAVSTASWASTPSRGSTRRDHRPLVTEALGSDITSYCPPLMVNLLHSLSLLQSAVRSNRVLHFQPSTACIISCVRFILSATECLPREAPVLKQFPALAQERKQILSVLASLATQAKKASAETHDEDSRGADIEAMLRLGGQVFSQVRRFLAVAVQCGIDIPERGQPLPSGIGIPTTTGQLQGQGNSANPIHASPTPPDTVTASRLSPNHATPRKLEPTLVPKTALRTKSLGDLRTQRRVAAYRDSNSSVAPLLPHRTVIARSKKEQYLLYERAANNRHKTGMASISSTSSSSSSFSSAESPRPLVMQSFPAGPSTTAEVMEALKFTQDQYLSTIAAFIGHAHSHSRSSHASSTGHMYDLVREIVEMVCKLLTIVEAVMRHPEIPLLKVGSLKTAKEGLYNVTSSLAESVRLLTMPLPPDITEETEKASLIRSATAACKAGADCVLAVKQCLNRSLGEKQFIIQVPTTSDSDPAPFTPSKFSRKPGQPSRMSMSVLQNLCHAGVDEEDLTIQAQTPSPPMSKSLGKGKARERSPDHSDTTGGSKSSVGSEDTLPTSPEGSKSLPSLASDPTLLDRVPQPSISALRRHDEGCLPDDSQHDRQTIDTFEDRLVNDELALESSERDPMGHDYPPEDVIYNSEGHLVAATIEVLVEKMTPHDSLVDPAFSAVFFLTFRLFCQPIELVEAIIHRYNIMPPVGLSEDDELLWQQHKGIPIRLRVSNFVKSWLEMYWRGGVDDVALPHLASFTQEALMQYFPKPSQRILDLILMRRNSTENAISPRGERARDPGMSINPPSFSPSEIPRPTMTKALLAALRSRSFATVTVTDFDALELARQLTIMECDLYCAIQPEEVLETGQEGTKPPVNVRAVSSLSTVITGWVAESILIEQDTKKRTLLVKFFIKVADRCTSLHNFSTPRSILAALDSSTISRLHQTWLGVPQKYKVQLEALRRLADHSRNFHEYRGRLRNTAPPAVPFLGLYLTDVTFCREGNPSYRDSPYAQAKKLLNFNKYHKLARIVQDMQRFQVPYNLKKIPEVQEYLQVAFENAKHHGDLQDLYRRSLLVEPRQPADTPPTSDMRQLFNWATRSQAQQPTSA
ncbi:ras GEF [Leucogyrophana mollusca]|uniref:Ras GEF n=1 Tax=Leucogyrophana mollusca TaxID=85980 RepID=A0ACB8BSS9_9AGAM|nr:ras GEF [Leucogyrophana mollusca]